MQKALAAKEPEKAEKQAFSSNSNTSLEAMTVIHYLLRSHLYFASADISQGEILISEFAEMVYTGYSLLTRTDCYSHCNCLSDLLADVQLCGECHGGCRLCISGDGHSRHFDKPKGDKKRSGRTPPPPEDRIIVGVVALRAFPL